MRRKHLQLNTNLRMRLKVNEDKSGVRQPHEVHFIAPGGRSPCCARAASGHTAARPSAAMKSRRRRQMLILGTLWRAE